MNMVKKMSAALVVAVALMASSTALADPGIHWSPQYYGTGNHVWSDHHGREIEISVNYLSTTFTQQLSGTTTWHRARAVCTWSGWPYTVTGSRQWGTANVSSASCGSNPYVSGSGGTGS